MVKREDDLILKSLKNQNLEETLEFLMNVGERNVDSNLFS